MLLKTRDKGKDPTELVRNALSGVNPKFEVFYNWPHDGSIVVTVKYLCVIILFIYLF